MDFIHIYIIIRLELCKIGKSLEKKVIFDQFRWIIRLLSVIFYNGAIRKIWKRWLWIWYVDEVEIFIAIWIRSNDLSKNKSNIFYVMSIHILIAINIISISIDKIDKKMFVLLRRYINSDSIEKSSNRKMKRKTRLYLKQLLNNW